MRTRLIVSVPRPIEEDWMVIQSDYAFNMSARTWRIGAILFPSPVSTNPKYICKAFLVADVVLGEENAIKSSLVKAHSANA
ncbi:unnamed protein product [Cuscuta campestris]|uniref:Uncharacterized protein n=1 Tax=Cuscuta campestris TaxID=132261 RepID=A0A484LIT4_9ASTE|nr:unnamed protein product [Cuscuta campestris]